MTLGELITLQRGHDLTDKERRHGRVPVMGAAGLNGYHDTARFKGPGIVMGRSGGSFGKVHFSEEDFWPHNTALYVTDFKGNDPRFVFYLLRSFDFSRFNSGSAQPSLNRNYVYPMSIRVPDPIEQHRIAS
ncbi:MAG TPA: restriction endonuclease subunit S, partial [Flavobacteriales bacterium]|nr:restriction endonuclease subunit S [Flavobacteriales bacterium]